MNVINRPTNVNASVSHSTGIPNWVLVLILTVITITLVVRTLRKPKVMVPKLKQKHTGIRHIYSKEDTIHLLQVLL